MSEDFTKAVVLKRNSKKKSGYEVDERDGEYFVTGTPARARVNVGDKIVGINGIPSDEFEDADDANDLIESSRIVVVPQDKIKEYEAAKEAEESGEAGGEESSEEEYEEVERPRSSRKSKAKAKSAPPSMGKNVLHCPNCGHDNEDLEPDEDGDLVCEECGNIIPEPEGGNALALRPDETPSGDQNYTCEDCGHENVNPEADEDGDKVCEECGTILEKSVPCPDCGYDNVNPQPDEEGDYVCEECGGILYIKNLTKAERLLAMHDEKAERVADGQVFGNDGKPVTNQKGKALTPADMFSPGDVITVTVGKSNPKQDAGLKVEEINGKYYVRKVPTGGLFAKTPVIAGDKIIELQGKDAKKFRDVIEMKKTLKEDKRITIVVLRRDPDASQSSASSVEFDKLEAVTPGGARLDPGQGGEVEDYDTVGYDGHDCGCKWCPECHPGPLLALTDGPADFD